MPTSHSLPHQAKCPVTVLGRVLLKRNAEKSENGTEKQLSSLEKGHFLELS